MCILKLQVVKLPSKHNTPQLWHRLPNMSQHTSACVVHAHVIVYITMLDQNGTKPVG